MVKPELGTKRVCVSCGARFYDLTKVRAVCPKCGTEQPIEQPRPHRTGGNVIEERRKKLAPAPDMEEAEIEDADELEDDADTIGPEIEVEPDHDRTERQARAHPTGTGAASAPARC